MRHSTAFWDLAYAKRVRVHYRWNSPGTAFGEVALVSFTSLAIAIWTLHVGEDRPMLSYRWIGIMKLADILSACIFIGLILLERPGLAGKKEGVILRTLILLYMLVLKRYLCKVLFVCPHCGEKSIFRGSKWWPKWWPDKDEVVFCPRCHKVILFGG